MARQRGSGLVATAAGVTAFVGFLLIAVHVLIGLYAATVVSSAGFEAARDVARAGGDERALAAAEGRLHGALGRAYDDVDLRWDLSDPAVVRLTVVADGPTFLPAVLDGPLPFDQVRRTFAVRVERFR